MSIDGNIADVKVLMLHCALHSIPQQILAGPPFTVVFLIDPAGHHPVSLVVLEIPAVDLDRRRPGEVLREDSLIPMGLKQQELADAIHVRFGRINEIVRGRRPMSPSTALRLVWFFGTSAGF